MVWLAENRFIDRGICLLALEQTQSDPLAEGGWLSLGMVATPSPQQATRMTNF